MLIADTTTIRVPMTAFPTREQTESMFDKPAPIRTDGSNSFAHQSMAVRVPNIIEDTLRHNLDYSSTIQGGLKRLHDEVTSNAPLRLFSAPAPDYDLWAPRFEMHKGDSWLDAEWLFAEMLVYRLMIEASQYWKTLRDPFAPFKRQELESHTLREALNTALHARGNKEERLALCLAFALWGNRIDLSLKQTAEMGTSAKDEHLLANDIPRAVDHLVGNAPGIVHVIMDNAGTEQAVDLVLVDYLLSEHIADTVILHLKMQPVLVSDAIVADLHALLDQMKRCGDAPSRLASRLVDFINTNRLNIVPDFFWNTDGRPWELPPRLKEPMSRAHLVIAKGDMNYRRMTNDALWLPSATLSDAASEFPAPLLVLRTLKSDTLVGIPEDQQAALTSSGEPNWRTSGAYGVAQFKA